MTHRSSITAASLTSLILAAVTFTACKDTAPTASASTRSAHAGLHSASAALAASVTIPPVGNFTSEVITRASFTDDIDVTFRQKLDRATDVVHVNDPSQVVMAKITIAPGGALPWHTHPGPAIVSVQSGELTIVHAEGCHVGSYPAGTGLVDLGQGHVHTGFNATQQATVVYVTYLDVPAGQSPLVPTSNPGC
jgi:hypothetical protein